MAIKVEPALAPHLIVDNAAAAIDFYVKAFDAVEYGRYRSRRQAHACGTEYQRISGDVQ